MQIAGYGVFSQFAHVGGYVSFFQSTESLAWDDYGSYGFDHDVSVVGFGLATKFGGLVGHRLFLSAGLDFGPNFAVSDVRGSMYGVQLFPRIGADVLIVENFGMTVAFGPLIVPYAVGVLPPSAHPDSSDRLVDATSWAVYLQALVGFSFGG